MKTNFTGRCLAFLLVFHIFAQLAFAAGPVILYPGSFDPFHKTHELEVQMVLKEFPDAQVLVLPIDQANYTPQIPGSNLPYPKFLDYVTRLQWIDLVFAKNEAVQVSTELEYLESSVLDEIIDIVRYRGATHLLVGIDVVRKWAAQGILKPIMEHVTLIVTGDPLQPELLEEFKSWPHEEVDHSKTYIMEGIDQGLRSVEVQKNILTSSSLEEYLPASLIPYIESGEIDLEKILLNYSKRVIQYLRMSFAAEAWSIISARLAERTGPELVALIENDENLLMFMSLMNLNKSTGAWLGQMDAYLGQKPEFRKLPQSSRLWVFSSLTMAFQHPDVMSWYERQSHFMEMLAGILLKMSGAAPKLQVLEDPPLSLGYKAFRFLMGPIGRQAQRILKPLYQLRVPDLEDLPESALNVSGTETITLYRGVRKIEDMDRLEQIWLQDGFLSKVALRYRQAGLPVEQAVQESEGVLQRTGIRTAIVNHIYGNWGGDTPYVSTSLDKGIAQEFAGIGGRVYTLEVPVYRTIFTNDLSYWQGTDWAETGNPSSKQLEVLVPHRIPPEDIKHVEVVESLPARRLVMSASFMPALRNYSQYFRQSARSFIGNFRNRSEPKSIPPQVTCRDVFGL